MVYQFKKALLRLPAPSVAKGLSASDHSPSHAIILAEHTAYAAALKGAGVEVEILPALDDFPDSLFVEDPALVFPAGAIVMRPGATSRFGEAAAIKPDLQRYFTQVIELGSGFAEGGDVLRLNDQCLIGLSERTNREGAEELQKALVKVGQRGEIVATPANVLHFKSDCSLLDEETVLSTPRLARTGFFKNLRVIETVAGEEPIANALRVNDVLFVAEEFPRTAEILARRYNLKSLKVSEVAKIDAGLSCMSLRW